VLIQTSIWCRCPLENDIAVPLRAPIKLNVRVDPR
jgi:hypothetical protein